jgi:phospholipid/cholesterol/gamma-HCH transport system ATP-binding protein|tara:strand:- start:3127 stop:3888 length:762 start_codon:yes stop_codon:yes gene_type:complete
MTATETQAASIEVRELKKAYGDQEVLKGVSFKVEPGQIFALMGPSGSGKSVLLRHLIGLEAADSGEALIADLNAADPETHDEIQTAIVFQSGALFNSMTVYDNLALYLREHRLCNEAEIKQRVESAMEALNIADTAKKIPAELSGGMRKRVAVARSIVMEPQVILYDEPTSELDPLTAATVSELIRDVRDRTGATTFIVTHDRELTQGIADQAGLLMDGKLVFLGAPEDLDKSSDDAVHSFMHPAIKSSSNQA